MSVVGREIEPDEADIVSRYNRVSAARTNDCSGKFVTAPTKFTGLPSPEDSVERIDDAVRSAGWPLDHGVDDLDPCRCSISRNDVEPVVAGHWVSTRSHLLTSVPSAWHQSEVEGGNIALDQAKGGL